MPSFWENLRFPGEREMDDLHGAQGQDMVTYVSAPSPSEGNSFPAVIVIMEAFGVTGHIAVSYTHLTLPTIYSV